MKKIDSKLFFDVLTTLPKFDCILEDQFGKYIEVDPLTALKFSEITGAFYVDDSTAGMFSLRGLARILQSAIEFKFVSGIYDNTEILNNAEQFVLERPYLIEGNKKIHLFEYIDYQEVNYFMKELRAQALEGERLVTLIDASKNDNGMEYSLEYFFANYMWSNGYFAETQSPLGHDRGTPDVVAIKSSLLQNCCSSGFNQIDVMFQKYFPHRHSSVDSRITLGETIVAEAKVGISLPTLQISKYLKTQFFDSGFALVPEIKGSNPLGVGTLSLDGDNRLSINSSSTFPASAAQDYVSWFNTYLRLYSISALSKVEYDSIFNSNSNFKNRKEFQEKLIEVAQEIEIWL